MIPQSVLDMINDATKKAYILTALEYIKNECISHSDVCKGCTFSGFDDCCFFQAPYFDGKIPEKWDLKELERRLQNDKR